MTTVDLSWKLRAQKAESEITRLRSELQMIDEALARRPALADIKDRYSKVYKACEMAGRAESAELKLGKAEAENKRLRKENHEKATEGR